MIQLYFDIFVWCLSKMIYIKIFFQEYTFRCKWEFNELLGATQL